MQLVGALHVLAQGFDQRGEQPGAGAHPVGQRRAFQLDAFAREDRALPVEREVVAVLGRDHVREQPGPGGAALDRPGEGGRLHDRLAAAAGVLGPDLADDLETSWHVLEPFADILAQQLEGAAAVRAGRGHRIALAALGFAAQLFARQVLG